MSLDIEALRSRSFQPYIHSFTTRDVILYHLGLGGCSLEREPALLYEGAEGGLRVLPTYAIVAAHPSLFQIPLADFIPGAQMARALHGEQYVELFGGLPTSGTLISRPRLVDVQDKGRGKGATALVRTETTDAASGRLLAVSEFVIFVLGAGGFGSPWPAAPRPEAATTADRTPDRPPDATAEQQTHPDQAALYRLSGDYNPLHVDPKVSALAGFTRPILHGLCTLGISVRLVLQALGPGGGDPSRVKTIKARFAKHVFPGERLVVRMWREGPWKVVFETRVLGRPGDAAVALSNAAVTFHADAVEASASRPELSGQEQSKL